MSDQDDVKKIRESFAKALASAPAEFKTPIIGEDKPDNPDFPLVTAKDHGIRPAGKPDECFYCRRKVGERHGPDCVIPQRRVTLRATVEFEVDVPAGWAREQIEFHRNDGSWCANNLVDDLAAFAIRAERTEQGCMCGRTKIEYLGDVDGKIRPGREQLEGALVGTLHRTKKGTVFVDDQGNRWTKEES
jgi:hypothetical protein